MHELLSMARGAQDGVSLSEDPGIMKPVVFSGESSFGANDQMLRG